MNESVSQTFMSIQTLDLHRLSCIIFPNYVIEIYSCIHNLYYFPLNCADSKQIQSTIAYYTQSGLIRNDAKSH